MSIVVPTSPISREGIIRSIKEYEYQRDGKFVQGYFVKALDQDHSRLPELEIYHRDTEDTMLFLFKCSYPARFTLWWSDDVKSSSDLLQIHDARSVTVNQQTLQVSREQTFSSISGSSLNLVSASFRAESSQSILVDFDLRTSGLIRIDNIKMKRLWIKSETRDISFKPPPMKIARDASIEEVTGTLEAIQTLVSKAREQITIATSTTVAAQDDVNLVVPKINNEQDTTLVTSSKPKPIVNIPSNKDGTTFAGRSIDSVTEENEVGRSALSFMSCADNLKQLMHKLKRK